ncbi:MAG: ATP-binding protein [Tenericutes bacterium HGW-Tenericutes-4]|jgi:fluoroquinolone transport system ATP-binding protein|nr:MAG: ATP-binding protein [Tenericutes bacterium HGW-Tenericutes-4]
MKLAFEVKNLKYKYPKGDKNVIDDISFEVNEGEIFGLLGPSGAGKSTTQRILIKLLEGFEGNITYFGKNLNELKTSYYEEIGVGFEMPVHFNKLTAMENVNFFLNLYKNRANGEELLKKVGLYEDKNKKVGEFSKGMKVRLNFVRSMLNNPRVLFLDEITNGLDPKNARIIKDQILEFKNNGGTVFLTTHLMKDVEELCDRVAFMDNGKIVEINTPRNLKLKYGKRLVTVEYNENNQTQKEVFDMENLGQNANFLNIIKEKEIETLHSGETGLDEIFIKITGAKHVE